MLYFYILELSYRFFYILISFFSCLVIAFFYIDILFLVETYPFLKFSTKKFIVTHTTDLINSIWFLGFTTSYFFIFPFFIFQIFQFLKSSWYKYQLFILKKLIIIPVIFYYVFIILCYLKLLPLILEFLTQWHINQNSKLLNIEIEFRILQYINWILIIRYSFSFLIYMFFIGLIQFKFMFFIKSNYKALKFFRKNFLYLTVCCLFILSPPEPFLQVIIILTAFVLYEIFFLVICYKIANKKYHLY